MTRLTFGVFYYSRVLALHDRDGRVGGAQVDTDDGTLDLLIAVDPLGIASPELRSDRGTERSGCFERRGRARNGLWQTTSARFICEVEAESR